MDVVIKLVYILIFPGLLFSSVFGLWLAGIDRKVLARMQKRVGPPVMQPTYDFFKLMGKETIVPDSAARLTFMLAPYIGLASIIITILFIPIAGIQAFSGVADIVVILYLLTIPALSIIFGGSASGSPFAGVGVSRSMVAIISYELPLILIMLTVGKLAGRGYEMGITFSLDQINSYQVANGPNLFHLSMIPAAVAMLLVIPCEVGQQPFDVGEAETEICEGPLVEYSGAPLAIFKLSHAVKMFVMTALFTALFLGGITTGMIWLDVIIFLVICSLVTLLSMTLAHAITARLKVEQLFKFFWTVVSGLALVSLILVWIGI
ncbi:MAG: NADH-quinone oxidoreductase subunit H [Clostridia bacterium]|nr:NADH-quinone oxidoreductase subunit H [Clostridia bacterium]